MGVMQSVGSLGGRPIVILGRIICLMAPRRLIPPTTVARWEAQLREAASKAVAEMHGNVRTTLAAHGVGKPSALVAASGKKKAATIGAGIALGVTVWKAAEWSSAVGAFVAPVAAVIAAEAVSAAQDSVPAQTTWGMPSPAPAISATLVASVVASGAYLGSRLNSNVSGAADVGQAVADVFDTADAIIAGALGAGAIMAANYAISEVGSYLVSGASGSTYSEASQTWVTAQDDKVRPDHEDADGQTVGLDEPFNVGGEDLMFPGDPSGSDFNVINCRCITVTNGVEPDEAGLLPTSQEIVANPQ